MSKEIEKKAEDTAAELRELIREAHAATRDMERARKDLIRDGQTIVQGLHEYINKQTSEGVEAAMKHLNEEVEKAIDVAASKVYKQFDRVAKILLGEDKKSRREGLLSLPELATLLRGPRV